MGASLNALSEELRGAAIDFVREVGAAGLQPRVTSTLRTRAEQTRLYRRYLEGLNPYPTAPPGGSAHEYGWAFDLVVTPYEYLQEVGQAWESWGGKWGGSHDPVHFELPGASQYAASLVEAPEAKSGGYSISQFLLDASDFGLGSVYASILSLFPGFSESKVLKALGSPVSTFHDHVLNFGLQSLIDLVARKKR